MIRDKKYLEWLRDQRCVFKGVYGSEYNAVEAMHIGTAGKGVKSPDDEALPALHSIHHASHQRGEMTVIREVIPDDVLRAALRAYARELYQQYKAEVAA